MTGRAYTVSLALLLTVAPLGSQAETVKAVSIWDPPTFVGAPGPRQTEFERVPAQQRSLGAFAVAETSGALLMSNGLIELGIRREGGRLWLASLRDAKRGIELLCGETAPAPLWALVLRAPSGKTSVFDAFSAGTPAAAFALERESGDLTLTLSWPTARPKGETGGTLGVAATVRLARGEPYARWRIAVDNRLTSESLWRVDFPIVPGPGRAGLSDVFHKTALHRAYDGEIHDHLFSVQFLTVGSLYLAAHDPTRANKQFSLRVGREFRQQVLAPDADKPGVNYRQPYDFVTGTSGGDWFDAAQLYRQWAQTQAWFGPLTKNRPATGAPAGQATAWITAMHPLTQDPQAVTRKALEFRDAVGAPVGIHWYNWASKPFVPRLFPAKKSFAEAAREAEAAGVPVMPYVSALYWCKWWGTGAQRQLWPEFEQARPYACRAVAGDWEPAPDEEPFRIEEDHYLVQVKQQGAVPMCRATEFWPRTLADQLRRLRAESGCSAVYLDMLAAAPRWPCFDRAHGHPAGGGDHWAKGNDRMMAALRDAVGPQVLLSGEGRYEGHIPNLDMDLVAGNETEGAVPVYEAVYGGQRLSFFRIMPGDDVAASICRLGLHWLQGQRPRVGVEIMDKESAEVLAFLRRLCRMRLHAGEFMDNGSLLRAPAWVQPPGRVRAERWMEGKKEAPAAIELPAVERSAWKLPDGRIGILLVNLDARPADVALDLSGLAGAEGGATEGVDRKIEVRDSEGAAAEWRASGTALSLRLPARDLRLCVFLPKTHASPR